MSLAANPRNRPGWGFYDKINCTVLSFLFKKNSNLHYTPFINKK